MSGDHSTRYDHDGRLFWTSDINVATSSAVEGLPDEQRTSPVRRTFLLFIFLELVLIFAFWLIYVRTLGNFSEQLKDQVVNLNFSTTFFDVQIISFARFIFLEVAYGACVTRRRWPSAASTAAITVYMLVKIPLFAFSSKHDSIGLSCTELVSPIVMAWLSTLFLECRVLPQERMAKRIVNTYQRINPAFLSAMDGRSGRFSTSVYVSPEGSMVNDVESLLSTPKHSSVITHDLPVDIAALLTRAEILRRSAWNVFEDPVWSDVSSGQVTNGPLISSASLHGFSQTVFRMEAIIHAQVKTIFNDIVHCFEFSPLWNSMLTSAKCLQKFSHEDVDIVHTVVSEVLGGLISPRDFVMLRAWGVTDRAHYVASSSVTYPKCAPSKKCVRGEQLINSIFLLPNENYCRVVCIVCCDLKGWFPSHVVAMGMKTSLACLYHALQNRAASLSASVEDWSGARSLWTSSPPVTRHNPVIEESC